MQNGQTLVYNQKTFEPMAVSSEAINLKNEYWNPNPHTNRWAAYDLVWMLMKTLFKRPVPTVLVGVGTLAVAGITWTLLTSTILVAANVVRPVDWRHVDKTDARQVAAWAGSNVLAPAARSATTVLVSAAKETQPNVQYVVDDSRSSTSEVDRQARLVSDRDR